MVRNLSAIFMMAFVSTASAEMYFGAKYFEQTKNEFCYYHISIPQVIAGQDSSDKQKSAAQTLNKMWSLSADAITADYNQAISEPDACSENSFSYTIDLNFEIKTPLNSKLISLVFADSRYTGGAHGNTDLASQVFNPADGTIYSDLSLFIKPEALPKLKELILTSLKQNEKFDQTMGFDQWAKNTTKVSDIKNFYFTQFGLVLIFNAYEIGSFAEGPYEPVVYYYDLKDGGMLQPGSPADLLPVGE